MGKIIYILPGVNIYGGVIIVLQHVNRLIERGYDACILSLDEKSDASWFPENKAKIYNGFDLKDIESSEIEIVVATHFSTVDFALKMRAKRYFYFVQSDERRFGMENINDFIVCEDSYKIPFEFMTEAIWIQRWLKEEFGKNAYYVPNGLDEKIIHKTEPLEKKSNKTRVLLEGSISSPFKGMQDAYDAVNDLDCELWIVSNNGKPKDDWKYDRFFEKVTLDKMKEIYSSCDIFLKMSRVEGFFGPPMEAMACGCAVVVGKVTGYDEYIKNNHNALVVEQRDVKGARNAVKRLIEDQELRKKIIENGHKTAQEWSWDRSIDLLERVVKKEPIEIFYSENLPEKYDYNLGVKNSLLNTIEKLKSERDLHVLRSGELELKIGFMESSVFWKMREKYLKTKRIFLMPFNKIKKYLKKTSYLVSSLYLTIKNEGFEKAILRLYNFTKYGKGVLNYDEEVLLKERYVPLKDVISRFEKK